MNVALHIEGLSARLGTHTVLDGLDLSLEAGSRTGLIGANGAGKTTLMDCIGGQVRPQTGRLTFDGAPITDWSSHRRARAGLARTFQRLGLLPELSARDNVQLALRNGPRALRQRRAEEALAGCGYDKSAQALVQQLSLLDRKRVALARAVVAEPQLLLLDEITAGLTTDESQDLLRALDSTRQLTVLWVEHNLQLLEHGTERTLLLNAGRIEAELPSEGLAEQPLVRHLYLDGNT